MKKKTYSQPHIEVVPLKMSGSLLLSTSNITSINSESDVEWGGPDDTGEALSSIFEIDEVDFNDWD